MMAAARIFFSSMFSARASQVILSRQGMQPDATAEPRATSNWVSVSKPVENGFITTSLKKLGSPLVRGQGLDSRLRGNNGKNFPTS
jgi:hypothetical protein